MESDPRGTIIYFEPYDSFSDLKVQLGYTEGFPSSINFTDKRQFNQNEKFTTGIYSDRWVGERGQITLYHAKDKPKLALTLDFPEKWLKLPTRLVISIDGKLFEEAKIKKPGRCYLEISLAEELIKRDKLQITLQSDAKFIPSEVDKASIDKRTLSFLIEKIEFN